MTDLPVQTFLIDCREASLASHRHTPKMHTKGTIISLKKKKKVHTHMVKLCYSHFSHRLKPDIKTCTVPKMSTHITDLYIPEQNKAGNSQIYTLPFNSNSPT